MSEPTEDDVRAEVSAWLKANWNPDYGLVEWRLKLIESGWGAPHYPKEWHGRGLPVKFNDIVDDEFNKIGAVTVCRAGIRTLAAATILDHGTDLHKEKFLRASSPARTPGASCSASPAPARTWRRRPRAPT